MWDLPVRVKTVRVDDIEAAPDAQTRRSHLALPFLGVLVAGVAAILITGLLMSPLARAPVTTSLLHFNGRIPAALPGAAVTKLLQDVQGSSTPLRACARARVPACVVPQHRAQQHCATPGTRQQLEAVDEPSYDEAHTARAPRRAAPRRAAPHARMQWSELADEVDREASAAVANKQKLLPDSAPRQHISYSMICL